MGKELVRNGGFETGDESFWDMMSGTLEIQDTTKKRGSYAAKITVDDTFFLCLLLHKDMVVVEENKLFHVGAWLKNVDMSNIDIAIAFYDSGLSSTGVAQTVISKSGVFDWTWLDEYILIPAEAAYAKIGIASTAGAANKYGYVDSVSFREVDLALIGVVTKPLFEVENETTSHTVNGTPVFSGFMREAEFFLKCTSLTGTSPTLNVKVQAYDPTVADWVDVVTFQELSTAGSERKTLLNGLGWKIRGVYTTGGTVTDCDFKLGAIMKR